MIIQKRAEGKKNKKGTWRTAIITSGVVEGGSALNLRGALETRACRELAISKGVGVSTTHLGRMISET